MMVSRDELRTLIEAETTSRCLSLYIPTVRAGVGIHQNTTRFQRMLRAAEKRLVQSGLSSQEARDLLDPVDYLMLEDVFWQQPGNGLVLFLSPELLKIYNSPLRFEEQVFVGKRFMIKPLLPLFNDDWWSTILALRHDPECLSGTSCFETEEMEMVQKGSEENPEEVSDEELDQRVLEMMQPIFDQETEDAYAQCQQETKFDRRRVSMNVWEIAPAAYYGRVERLFLMEGEEYRLYFDPDAGVISPHQEDLSNSEDVDLLDFAAAHTLLNEGKIHLLQPNQMPESVLVMAVFRD